MLKPTQAVLKFIMLTIRSACGSFFEKESLRAGSPFESHAQVTKSKSNVKVLNMGFILFTGLRDYSPYLALITGKRTVKLLSLCLNLFPSQFI